MVAGRTFFLDRRTNARKVRQLFTSAPFKLGAQFSQILQDRTWPSPTPEAQWEHLSAWCTLKQWDASGRLGNITDGWWTVTLNEHSIVGNEDSRELFLPLKPLRWSCFAHTVTHVTDPDTGVNFFHVNCDSFAEISVKDPPLGIPFF